jgi:putative transposase
MARKPRVEFEDALYHVIVRGNHRRDIFRDQSDRVAYVKRIEDYRNRYRCIVYAYVLTSNHVHSLIETCAVGLSKISSRLGDNGVGLNNLYNLERS